MRLFSALEIAPAALVELARLQAALQSRVDFRRWQPSANMHLTIHFFGEVPEDLVPRLAEHLAIACQGVAPFSLRLGSLGAFPRRGQPRVLWLGVEDPSQGLSALEARMRSAIGDLGLLREERTYSPHITLARESRGAVRVSDLADEVGSAPIVWQVDHAALYRSVLTPQGAQYSVLQRFAFQGEARR